MNAVTSTNGTDNMASLPMTELQKQEKALNELGSDYQFPLFNGRHALESQRKSAYKTTARAAREIVDNAYEAGATKCWIVLDRPQDQTRNKNQRRDAVSAIAFVDNGPGMLRNMVRYALSWGGGSRFDNPTGIGRFGFGLPNASINQTRRVEVYSRTGADQRWYRAVLDITPQRLANVPATGLVNVDPVEDANLPEFVEKFLQKEKIELGSATIVVWDKPDRITVRSAARLREHLLEDFGVVYRNLLNEFGITIDGVQVKPVDPLFLTPGALCYLSPEEGGAQRTFDRSLPVKYFRDPETGAQHLELLASAEELALARKDPAATVSVISVVISRFPYGFAARRVHGKQVEKDSDAFRRLQIRRKRRGVSYVRAKREIDYVDHFPTLATDAAVGLGTWPILQSYALHWGMEVKFGPELDDAFGIGNDKQTVNPIEDVWRVFATAEIDRAVQVEQDFQRKVRQKADEEAAAEQVTNPDATNPAIEAAQEAEAIIGAARPLPEERVVESQERLKDAVEARQRETGQSKTDAEEALRKEANRKLFGIDFFESVGGVFMRPDWGNGLQKIAKINKAHPFYKVFYTHVAMLPDAKPRQALDLLLMALAKSELEAGDTGKRVAEYQREQVWSPFLKAGYDSLEAMQVADPEEKEEETGSEEA